MTAQHRVRPGELTDDPVALGRFGKPFPELGPMFPALAERLASRYRPRAAE